MNISGEITANLNNCLKTAIAFDNANKGILQIYYPEKKVLKIVTSHGLSSEFLQNFHEVTAFTPTACGRALGILSPVAIQDVFQDNAFKPFLNIIVPEDFRAIRAMPLMSKNKSLLGMLTVQFKKQQPQLNQNSNIPNTLIQEICTHLQNILMSQNTLIHL